MRTMQEEDLIFDVTSAVGAEKFDDDAILVKVHCFLITTDFPESLEIGEELNYEIMSIVQATGASFALPGRALYMEEQSPVTTS